MKTGLFFGSFNPIHTGHLIIAQYLLNEAKLDKIKFIVSPHNPLKPNQELMDANKRLEIVKLSVADNHNFEVDDIEFNLPVPSYTSLTLEELIKRNSGEDFHIIMGSDNLENLEKWKNFEQVLQYKILVYKRTSAINNPFPDNINITIFDSPLLTISATTIRKMLAENKSVKYLVRDEIISILKKEL